MKQWLILLRKQIKKFGLEEKEMYNMFNSLKSVVAKRAASSKSVKGAKGFKVVYNRIDIEHCYDNLYRYS